MTLYRAPRAVRRVIRTPSLSPIGTLAKIRHSVAQDNAAAPAAQGPRGATVPPNSALNLQRMSAAQETAAGERSPVAIDAIPLKLAQVNATPGEYWLIKREGKEPWPGVLCDEHMVAKFFKGTKRPKNAMRHDGTWHRSVSSTGGCTGMRCFPFLDLGTLEL